MKILLSGANGRTGRPIIAALANKHITVRAFIRDKIQEEALKTVGASEFSIGDMMDQESIDRAVKGCDKVIHIGPPMHPNEVEITQSFINAALKADVKHFIYYSVMHPLRRDVRHHKLKLDAEEALIESGLPYTILQPSRYMQHLEAIWQTVKESGVHAMPFDINKKFNVVDLFDLAEATAIVAASGEHLYATYELAGPESLSQLDMAETISKIIGRPVTAKAISMADLEAGARKKGFSDDRIGQMIAMNKHYDEYGFLGNSNVLSMILGRQPNRFANYVASLDGV